MGDSEIKAPLPAMETVVLRYVLRGDTQGVRTFPTWEEAKPHYDAWVSRGDDYRCEVQRVSQPRKLRSR